MRICLVLFCLDNWSLWDALLWPWTDINLLAHRGDKAPALVTEDDERNVRPYLNARTCQELRSSVSQHAQSFLRVPVDGVHDGGDHFLFDPLGKCERL